MSSFPFLFQKNAKVLLRSYRLMLGYTGLYCAKKGRHRSAFDSHSALFTEDFEIVFPFGVPVVVSSVIGRAMGLC